MGKNFKMDLAGPSITQLEIDYVMDAMKNGWYNYDYVEKFEPEFAKYHGRKFGIMTPNCTSSIHLILLSLDIKPGDEIIVPECTWTATAAPITYCGATPVFCDIEEDTWCLSPESVLDSITDRTKAIIAVDLYGNMPKLDILEQISREKNIPLIEDAAESLGSIYKGKRAGKFGLASVFSFHRTKTMTTGEGGILLTDDEELYERARFLRDHGRDPSKHFYTLEAAYKYMPSNLQAAIGYAQFKRIDDLVNMKRNILSRYKSNFSDKIGLQLNHENSDTINGAWLSVLVFSKEYSIRKSELMKKIEALEFPARPFFYPLSSLPAYSNFKTGSKAKNPVSYDLSERGITLPSALNIDNKAIDAYSNAVLEILENK